MRFRPFVMTVVAVMLVMGGLACGAGDQPATAAALELATVHYEQNATDEDVEVLFEVSGDREGLAELTIVAPDGRTVVDFHAPDTTTLGMRKFRFESPEPPNVPRMKAAYPEGVYRFAAKTVSGAAYTGEATLSHELPGLPEFIVPAEEGEGVPFRDLEVKWGAVAGATSYIVEIELEDTIVNLRLALPGDTNHFMVPNGFLEAGTEYKIAIGAMNAAGNITFVETTFTTGG